MFTIALYTMYAWVIKILTMCDTVFPQFLERFYDLMVNSGDELTLKDMLAAFSNIAR